ncbi:hypothetical protein Msil_3177 [Methylocella silvestris BL2]|uniref:Uncharacterized protein n=1 Tax=Methylocella silvestris (strain DSM 15510 / CIP 108128 / LMG 27833 / NCIMB 13906 / BL2) TaxID=395965 RepID=B8EMF7_METSB|nr:hypothetical protein Msil_3177 [Methylocella silvestris BL2]
MRATIRFERQRQPLDNARGRAQAQFPVSARALNAGSSNFRFDASPNAAQTKARAPAAFVQRPLVLLIPADEGAASTQALTIRWRVEAAARLAPAPPT